MVIVLSLLGSIILLAGLVGTLALAGKGDEKYSASMKGNVTRLSMIYIILIILLIIGIGIFILY
jgi:predicted transporter